MRVAFHLLALSDRRILTGLRCIDGITQTPIRQNLRLQAEGGQVIRNRSGDYALLSAPGFESYRHTFDLSTLDEEPAATTIEITISDPSGVYLPRQFSLTLPRSPDVDSENSLFQPAIIALYPSPLCPINPGWAVLRATVLNSETNQRLPWALIETTQSSQTTLAQADGRGEALIAVPGIPVTTWSTDSGIGDDPPPVTTTEVIADIAVLFDPVVTPLDENTDFSSFTDPNDTYLSDPDQLNDHRFGLLAGTQTVPLASGRVSAHRLAVSLTPIT